MDSKRKDSNSKKYQWKKKTNTSSSVHSHLIRNKKTNNPTNNRATKPSQSSSNFSAETLALSQIADKITESIGDRLYYAIHPIQPLLAGRITAMFLDSMRKPHIENVLNDSAALHYKINEAVVVLKDHQRNLYDTNYKSNSDNIRKTDIDKQPSSVTSSVSMVATAASSSASTCSINYLSSASNQSSFSSSVVAKLEAKIEAKVDDASQCAVANDCRHTTAATTKLETKIETKIELEIKLDDTPRMPSRCSIRTVRLIINAPVSKPIFKLILQQKCIPNPTAQSFEKIFVRCHKSYYHPSATVIYAHFVNFEDRKFNQCVRDLFDFNPYATHYDYISYKAARNTKNIIDLIGNKFGLIALVNGGFRQYPKIEVPVEYLSKMVKICLRCKLNEAESRKRVCKYCLAEEINDRKKIAQYYKDPNNKASSKSNSQIEADLIQLKIEPHLIPTPLYKTECHALKNGKCTRQCCTFVHNPKEKQFGKTLMQIQKAANRRKYASIRSSYELSSYQTIGLQFKYRRIICKFYEQKLKFGAQLVDNESYCDFITKELVKRKVQLHLIPLVYKSNCREERCRGRMCSFVHPRNQNDRIFGDILWRIKCIARNKFDTASVQSQQSVPDEKQLLFDGDMDEKKDKHEWNRSPIEREWGYAIRPYIEAVNDERAAEIKELAAWSIEAGHIALKIEAVKCVKNVEGRVYELFVIYEDDKDAKVTPFRTYVNFLFPREFDVGLRTRTADEKPTKQRDKQCPACYFNVCDNTHWTLEKNRIVLAPIDGDYEQKNDSLQGVVVEKLPSRNPKKKRYKVMIEKYGRTDDITPWLKFALVASKKFNKNHRNDFENVHISYNPSNVWEQIEDVLKGLDENKHDQRTEICKIAFGIQNTKPSKLTTGYSTNQIQKLFPELNCSQISAIYGALTYNFHTIQGPPATGKSWTCAHIGYLWWLLNINLNHDGGEKTIIHGVVPTNQGCLVLAQKCDEMNRIARKNNIKTREDFKVLFLASKTYADALLLGAECKANVDKICANVIAEKKLRRLDGYTNMDRRSKERWKDREIARLLNKADMIITTFGNSRAVENIAFSHVICDESNQGSLDTFLGIIQGKALRHLCMAGDIQQLAPVTKSENVLAKKSVYEDIISYLTNKTNKINAYYTRLNKQYRSHPQIYAITTELFYGNSVDTNANMEKERAFGHGEGDVNYEGLFANKKNHIQWHIYGQTQLDTSSMQQSKCNKKEAQIAVKYVKRFIIGLKNPGRERDIAVISDYRAQIEETRRLLQAVPGINAKDILLCTINEIEGSSKPIVIYMCCRSNNTGNIGFLRETNRANVALSRAEYAQIVIGDPNTLQYNPVYNKIFAYHRQKGAVVCENADYNPWDNNSNWIKQIRVHIPLVNLSKHDERIQRNDYHVCSGCGRIELEKLFCGRSCSNVDLCAKCMNKYLSKYCRAEKKLRLDGCSRVIPIANIEKSEFCAADSNGVSLEFDILLGRYLNKNRLIQHMREDDLSYKLWMVARRLCGDIWAKHKKYVPACFRTLVGDNKLNESCSETSKALGIMRCKRSHLLQQSVMNMRFFQIVNKIRYNNEALKEYYKHNSSTFYLHREFEQYQPTTIVVAYLQCCGYSQIVSNRLRTRIARELFDRNKSNPGKYEKRSVIPLDKGTIHRLAYELQSNGIRNVLSGMCVNSRNVQKWGVYIIELMQRALIVDTTGPYYQHLTHENAITAEVSFGDKLAQAGFDYIAEKELKERGFPVTPDYYLKKSWIINYNGKSTEINWLDFKNNYCSATEWNIDKLNCQAIKYNARFGPGAFIFSLGFVRPPQGLQLNCYGLLAAVPLSKCGVAGFIEKRINERKGRRKKK